MELWALTDYEIWGWDKEEQKNKTGFGHWWRGLCSIKKGAWLNSLQPGVGVPRNRAKPQP